jgi:hypothetical protein
MSDSDTIIASMRKNSPSDAARYLYFYFLTAPHQTGSGCFVAKEAYALADLDLTGSDWTKAKYREALQALVDVGLVLFDAETSEVLVERWWQDNGPSNEKWFVGAAKQVAAINSLALRKAAQDSLEVHRQEFEAGRCQILGARKTLPTSLTVSPEVRQLAEHQLTGRSRSPSYE